MKIDLRRIFDEYRGSESAQVRRNLGTALAAIGDDDSLERLVNMAMTDPDESVRLRAFSDNRSRRLIKCAKDSGHYPPLKPSWLC
jgi:HEAT repeat protein